MRVATPLTRRCSSKREDFRVLADVARPGSAGNVSLLNAAWAFTTAAPLPQPGEGWTLPAQALVVFIEAQWQELNKPHSVVIALQNEDSEPVEFRDAGSLRPATITTSITVPSTPGAPNGTSGRGHVLVDLGGGTLLIRRAPGRFIWRVTVGSDKAEVGFWVNVPPQQPKIGS